jgi:hypothetical protein
MSGAWARPKYDRGDVVADRSTYFVGRIVGSAVRKQSGYAYPVRWMGRMTKEELQHHIQLAIVPGLLMWSKLPPNEGFPHSAEIYAFTVGSRTYFIEPRYAVAQVAGEAEVLMLAEHMNKTDRARSNKKKVFVLAMFHGREWWLSERLGVFDGAKVAAEAAQDHYREYVRECLAGRV